MKKKLIFTTGSGRCGTSSLSFLLNSQESALVAHELFPILPWIEESKMTEDAARTLQFKFFQLTHQSHNYDIVGDSGSYYMPYIETILKTFSDNKDFDVKFVILKRNKQETVASFETKFTRQNNNPLQNHSGLKNEWDNSFPKYSNFWTVRESIEKYYDDYYNRSNNLSKKYPEHVKIFDTDVLNSDESISSLFEYLEIKNPNIKSKIRKNSG